MKSKPKTDNVPTHHARPWLLRWGALLGVVLVAAFLRLWKLNFIPAGLTRGEAELGLSVMQLLQRGQLPGFSPADNYSPLMVWLQALPVLLFGTNTWSMRLVPALFGILAVVSMWLWARAWFNDRVAFIAAFLMAVVPWSITLSRTANAAALIPALLASSLWLGTMAYRQGTMRWWVAFGTVLGLCLFAGPLGWVVFVAVAATMIVRLASARRLPVWTRPRIIGAVMTILLGAVAAFVAGGSAPALGKLLAESGVTAGSPALMNSMARALLMFNVRGDDDYAHNLSGEPLLNVFVGLMFICGLLLAAASVFQNRYRRLLVIFAITIIPVMISTDAAPNALRASTVLAPTMLLAALGISYLLNLWYQTFPINNAARLTGRVAVGLLLALTLAHGFTQYFHAWAGSSETYQAYHEGAVEAAAFSRTLVKPNDTSKPVLQYLVAEADEAAILKYVGPKGITVISGKGLAELPVPPANYQFVITAAARDASLPPLAQKFPGGKLKPHNSRYTDEEIFYSYEVAK